MAKRAGILLLFIFGLLVILFHEPIVDWLDELFSPADPRPAIATLDETNGETSFKKPKTLVYKRGRPGIGLRDQDTLVTGAESRAVVSFKSGFRLEVGENSIIIIEQPTAGSDGAIRVTFLRGDFRVLDAGSAGSLILNKGGVQQDPAGRAPPPKPVIVSVKPLPKREEPPAPEPVKTEKIEEIKKVVEKPKVVVKAKPRETLSDEYIASIIKKQTPFFNRCYAEHLRLNPKARGRINLAFTISPIGSVSNVRLLGSTLKDLRLEQCTMSVVERARFKKFDGDPIVVNYPINFE